MKRKTVVALLCIVLCVCFCSCPGPGPKPPTAVPSTIRIATFNALRLGHNNGKSLQKLVDVLSAFDVVALEEVMNEDTLKAVKEILGQATGSPWEYVISGRKIGRSSYKEYYAIIFRTDRTQLLPGSAQIWNDADDKFEREPFSASFRSGNFDYTIIVMHSDFDSNKEVMRAEARNLRQVFETLQDRDAKENDLILVGDFNLPADDEGWSNLRSISTVRNLLPGTTRTTLSASGALSSAYDNIWIQDTYTHHEYADTTVADYYFTRMFRAFEKPGAEARRWISDHVPVYAVFWTNREDDD